MGRVLFFLPVAAALILVILGLATFTPSQPGTLVVEAFSSARYSPSVQLHAAATVGTETKIAPFNLSLPQGDYLVSFGSVNWYVTPPPRSILLSGGRTEFAVGTYVPVVKAITMTQSGFNSTTVTALHGVTPVTWINVGNAPITLEITHTTSLILNPFQNYTMVFSTQGAFNFDIRNTGLNGTVSSL